MNECYCHEIGVCAAIGLSVGKHDILHNPDWVAVKIQLQEQKLGFQQTYHYI
jgi:hypothetical protein